MSFVLLASLSFFVGCKVVVLSGPVVVSVGDTVSYVLELQSDFGFGPDPPLFVLAEVPAGWQFKSSSFVGTVGGSPISGTPLLVQDSPCEFQLGDLRPDYQRWHLISPGLPSGFDTSDRAQLTLEFFVGGQPSDEIKLFFVLGNQIPACSRPEVLVVNYEEAPRHEVIQVLRDDTGGVDGLDGPQEIVLSPDNRHLYVAGKLDRSIAAFARDESRGQLTFLEADTDAFTGDDPLGSPVSVASSPDGLYLYSANRSGSGAFTDGIAVFSRDPTGGEVTLVEHFPTHVD